MSQIDLSKYGITGVKEVESFDESYIVSIISFYKDGLIYTFVKDGDEQGFLFYTIETEEGEQEW